MGGRVPVGRPMRNVSNGGPPVGPLTVILWLALTGGRPQPANVHWAASVPLWTSVSPGGKVIDAGPAPAWASPPPAARLGALPPIPRETPNAESGPRELPKLLVRQTDEILPPGPRLVTTSAAETPFAAGTGLIRHAVCVDQTQPCPSRQANTGSPPGPSMFAVDVEESGPIRPPARLGAPSR